jgi:D-hydroxyproline dehydrogenase subunit beta
MRDVAIVGGGIVGVACAHELTRRGMSVTLIEREELAAGASGRNQGWFVLSADPACAPMSRASLPVYLGIVDSSPVPIRFDREPIGHLLVAYGDRGAAVIRERAAAWAATGVGAERLDAGALLEEEPALAPGALEAWLLDHGHRLDPAALTVGLAHRARDLGADIRLHTTARALIIAGERVTGVVTDQGVIAAGTVIVAAGPWSAPMLRTVGVELPVTGARGWIVELDASHGLLRHLLEEERDDWTEEGFPTASELASSRPRPAAVAALLHPAPDGAIVCGASHQPALRAEPEDSDAPSRIAARAVEVIPALADVPVRSIRWGIRPMSPDGRPLVGWVRDGLLVATGHGPEGVLLGAGTAALVGTMLARDRSPFDAAPFDPLRFG